MNSSSQTNNLKDILQNKIDDLEKQVLSRVNSLEEGKLSPRNESEERGKIESTLTSLHQRISDLEKGTGRCPALPARPREPRAGSRSPPRRRAPGAAGGCGAAPAGGAAERVPLPTPGAVPVPQLGSPRGRARNRPIAGVPPEPNPRSVLPEAAAAPPGMLRALPAPGITELEGFAPRCHLKARYITGWGGGEPPKGQKGGPAGAHRPCAPAGQKDNRPPDRFQLTFPLRTNYMYAKVKKSLPEMYAFSICMWIKSSASPGMGTPFSYAVPGQANELVLIEWGNNPMEILINDKVQPRGAAGRGGRAGEQRGGPQCSPP